MKKLISLLLSLAMLLSVASMAGAAEITELHTYETQAREVETWNVLKSQKATDNNVMVNLVDGLLTNNNKGELIPAAAKEWYTEDGGATWTFKLNEGMVWCDQAGNVKAPVKASDWLWGMEWVLNFAKNDATNTSMPFQMVKGAQEYYNYTKELCDTEGVEAAKALELEKFSEMVGVKAVDDTTLVYTATYPMSYFPTVCTYTCFYPLSDGLLAEIGVDGYRAAEPATIWYSGPYIMESFIAGNEKVFVQNPNYFYASDTEGHKRFERIIIKMIESQDVAYQLFQTGELDHCTLSPSNLTTIYNNPSNEFHKNLVEARPTKYSYQIHFNFDKLFEDGTPDENWNKAVANEAFRQLWYYGLDLTEYLRTLNAINPLACVNYAYSANRVAVKSDGTDYAALVVAGQGLSYDSDTFMRYNPDKAAELKAKAIEELTAAGVTFPISVDYYIAGGNQTQLDSANALKQTISDYIGDDFMALNILTYVSSLSKEVAAAHKASIYINGWGADFGDPINFLSQETYGEDGAYYTNTYSFANNATDEQLIATYKEFTELTNAAHAITDDNDARYDAFAKAELYMMEHALCVPIYYDVQWELTCVNDYTKVYTPYGSQTYRYINWETNSDIYTTEDYAAFAAAAQ